MVWCVIEASVIGQVRMLVSVELPLYVLFSYGLELL